MGYRTHDPRSRRRLGRNFKISHRASWHQATMAKYDQGMVWLKELPWAVGLACVCRTHPVPSYFARSSTSSGTERDYVEGHL